MIKFDELEHDAIKANNHSKSPCFSCEHLVTIYSSIFGSSDECELDIDGWYDIYDCFYDERSEDTEEHFKNICSSFLKGEGKEFILGG